MSEPQNRQPPATGPADRKRWQLDNYAYAAAPRIGWRGYLRWMWRQITSMRVALVLLLLLTLAAIPGSILPQFPQDAFAARRFIEDNPRLGPWLEKLGFLDVFGSSWFTAIYLLLFASLIGCIIPRAVAHARAWRTPVPLPPSRLTRFAPLRVRPTLAPAAALDQLATFFLPQNWWGRIAGYRVRRDDSAGALVAAQGHFRELGNIVFHLSLVGVLLAMVVSSSYTYRGQAVIIEGRSFTNAVVSYDSFSAGRFFQEEQLQPFTLRLDDFEAQFSDAAQPLDFLARVTLTEPDQTSRATQIKVNHPLSAGGGKIYLTGNGYAPVVTVRDGAGAVAFSGPVPFLPQDDYYTSDGVIKVPDVSTGPQLGFKAILLPTAIMTDGGALSLHPTLTNPAMVLTAYTGDLGLDTGIPQNVYELDEAQLSPVRGDDGLPLLVVLAPGETITLPEGLGQVTWEDTLRFAAFDLRADPALPWLLVAAVGVFVGIAISLFAPQRRLWFRVVPTPASADYEIQGAINSPGYDENANQALVSALSQLGRVIHPGEQKENHDRTVL